MNKYGLVFALLALYFQIAQVEGCFHSLFPKNFYIKNLNKFQAFSIRRRLK